MYCVPMYALMRILPGVNIKKKKCEMLARAGHGWFQRVPRFRNVLDHVDHHLGHLCKSE